MSLAESLIALTDVAVVRNDPPATLRRVFGRLRLALDPAFLCHPFLAPRVGGKNRLLAVNAGPWISPARRGARSPRPRS